MRFDPVSYGRRNTTLNVAVRAALIWVAAAAAATGCGLGEVDVTGTGGAGSTGSGGSGAGTGGTTGGSTGGTSGSGGAAAGTGGAAVGTGGRAAGTGGAAVGTGGAAVGTGGATGGRGGAGSSGGRVGTGGRGTGGTAVGGSTGAGGGAASLCTWPTAVGANMPVSASIPVSGTYDGGMKRFVGSGPLGTAGQGEDQGPLFDLANGATLQNVILGSPAADGVHCAGTCTLKNVWWEDVGEDAATARGSSASTTFTIDGGGAKAATDKVFQHNGAGTMVIKNFCAQDFGKLYRSCGNCSTQYERHLQLENVMIIPRAGSIAGVNTNYMDSATFKNITIRGATNSVPICERFTGNSTGAEPVRTGAGADGTYCIYAASDITWQ